MSDYALYIKYKWSRFLRASWSRRASDAYINIASVRDLPTDNNANCLLNILALLFISFHLHLNCYRKILGPFNKQGKWALERCGKLAKDTEIINATTRSSPRLSTPKPMHLQMSQAKAMTSVCHRMTSTSFYNIYNFEPHVVAQAFGPGFGRPRREDLVHLRTAYSK